MAPFISFTVHPLALPSTPTGFHNKAWGRRANGAPQENSHKIQRTPTGFHISNSIFRSAIGIVEPRWGSGLTWGAPQRGDPRLCCETLSGLKHTISLRKNLLGVATHCLSGILAVGSG